jgi:hypothetical protein
MSHKLYEVLCTSKVYEESQSTKTIQTTISSDQQVRTCHFLIYVSTSQTKQNVYLDHPLYESSPTSNREC